MSGRKYFMLSISLVAAQWNLTLNQEMATLLRSVTLFSLLYKDTVNSLHVR